MAMVISPLELDAPNEDSNEIIGKTGCVPGALVFYTLSPPNTIPLVETQF